MVYWSFTLRDVNVGNFSLLHGPTKDLEDNATAKDFFNQFIYDDYLKAAASKLHFSVAQGVEKTIESLSSRRFCHHGRQIAEEVWIDNGVFGAKF